MTRKKMRPHHLYCMRFLQTAYPERGEGFGQALKQLLDLLFRKDDTILELSEGVDELCHTCHHCEVDRCQSPKGNEEAVRKWDHLVLKGLSSSYGEAKTAKEWRRYIAACGPLDYCRNRCPKNADCSVFTMGDNPPRS